MKKGLLIKLTTLMLSMALIFTMAVPGMAFGATSTKAPAAPKITSISTSLNTVTIKWSKVRGADFYKVFKRTTTKEWKYLKSVKKTSANKKKYSNKVKYKLKVTKDGKRYKVYVRKYIYKYKVLKKTTKRTYTFKGKYNKRYTFVVKAHKDKKYSKYSKAKSIKTEKKPQGEIIWPPEDDDPDNWDVAKEAEYVEILNDDLSEVSKNVRITALELYKKLAAEGIENGENTMISPVSFLTAMGMLENGAKGETLSEIEEAFRVSGEDFNTWFKNWYGLVTLKSDKTLKLADSIWIKDDDNLTVNQSFCDKVGDIYDAQFYKKPFDMTTVKDINDWVNEKTDQMIPSIIDDLSKDTVMALINATCFRGKWVEPFSENGTRVQTFTREDGTTEDAEMMTCDEYRYFENDLVTGTFKNYRKGYKIMFLLPKEKVKVKDVLESLTGDDLYKLDESSTQEKVILTVPKFKFDYTAPSTIDALKAMGIERVFDDELADLSDMATYKEGDMDVNIYVSKIVHKTHIDLHEKGTDAAAVTAIFAEKASCAPGMEYKEVRLDRPFIFAIVDDDTCTPIFMGTVQSIG